MSAIDKNGLPLIGVKQPRTPLVDEFAGRLFAELDYVTVRHAGEGFGVEGPAWILGLGARACFATCATAVGVEVADGPGASASWQPLGGCA